MRSREPGALRTSSPQTTPHPSRKRASAVLSRVQLTSAVKSWSVRSCPQKKRGCTRQSRPPQQVSPPPPQSQGCAPLFWCAPFFLGGTVSVVVAISLVLLLIDHVEPALERAAGDAVARRQQAAQEVAVNGVAVAVENEVALEPDVHGVA